MSRVLLVLMGVMLLIRRRNDLFTNRRLNISSLNLGLTEDKILRWSLLIFFALIGICDFALLRTDTGEALKGLFALIAEGYVLIWMLTLILDTREKLIAALRILVFSSGVTAIIAVIGTVIDTNLFYYLNTVQREMMMAQYYRLGMLRAEAGFGHPVFYGAFCAVIIPINMYFLECAKNRREKILYMGCLVLNLVGLVLSNSRGSLCAFACLVILAACIRIYQKRFVGFCKTYVPIGLIALLILSVIALFSPAGLGFLRGIFNSLVNTVAPNTVPTDVVTNNAEVIAYGANDISGVASRLVQLSGIQWTLEREPLFGLGYNAEARGLVSYEVWPNQWKTHKSFDMALVAIVCQYGFLGLIGYTALYGSLFKTISAKKYRKDPLMHFLGLAFIAFLLCLITIADLIKMSWIIFAGIVCLTNVIQRERLIRT